MHRLYATTTSSIAAYVAASAILVGCSTVKQPDPAVGLGSQVTVADVCESLTGFFVGELGAVDLRSAPVLSPEVTVVYRGECTLVNTGDGLATGKYLVRHAPDDPDPTGNLRGYEKTVVDGREIWIWDWRKNPWYSIEQVLLAIRTGVWNATLEIDVQYTRTADGDLEMTDENLRRAVAFLIDYTAELTRQLPEK
ncbi:hypothetical protein [Nocardia arizonensis]|uniref:hypothetical protein n=1 Tax=Nocardia arizonensis TaxID=1141647 RepID=UPI0006D13A04|nr:hypothetical protein [Nocardia arizonensis]